MAAFSLACRADRQCFKQRTAGAQPGPGGRRAEAARQSGRGSSAQPSGAGDTVWPAAGAPPFTVTAASLRDACTRAATTVLPLGRPLLAQPLLDSPSAPGGKLRHPSEIQRHRLKACRRKNVPLNNFWCSQRRRLCSCSILGCWNRGTRRASCRDAALPIVSKVNETVRQEDVHLLHPCLPTEAYF